MLSEIGLLLEVTRAFDALKVPYAIGGSVASSALGFVRTTQDADIVADLEPRHVSELCRRLAGAFVVDAERMLAAIAKRSQFQLVHLGARLKIDVYLPKHDAFSRQQLIRRQRIEAPGAPGEQLTLTSAEDLVLQKLRWYRQGGEVSERQWLDVLGVLKVQAPTIDRAYLRRWADEIGVHDLLDRAFEDAGYT